MRAGAVYEQGADVVRKAVAAGRQVAVMENVKGEIGFVLVDDPENVLVFSREVAQQIWADLGVLFGKAQS